MDVLAERVQVVVGSHGCETVPKTGGIRGESAVVTCPMELAIVTLRDDLLGSPPLALRAPRRHTAASARPSAAAGGSQ